MALLREKCGGSLLQQGPRKLGAKRMRLIVGGTLAVTAMACTPIAAPAARLLGDGGLARGQSDGGVVVHQVGPRQTDPRITGPPHPNLAMIATGVRQNGLLVVFLPGTGGKPGCCQLFLRQAALLGFHAIGLQYNNQTAVGAKCLNSLRCFGTVRQNVFDGTDPTPRSAIPPRDGVEHRLSALLSYLVRRYPGEGWGQFLLGAVPRWGSIVISGHSQGGGEAAFIGAERGLSGVVTLSSPPDTDLHHQPATWVYGVPSGATPLARVVAFVHTRDPFYARIVADWGAMNLARFGSMTSVDSVAAPYDHSHQLISSAALPHVVLATHDSTAVDSATPRCPDGSPEYAPVWSYMLEVAGGLPQAAGQPACAQ